MNTQDKLLRERDAALILGVSVHWLRKKRCQGGGPPYIKYDRAVFYEREALLQWRAARRVIPSETGLTRGHPF
jgi:hypothetical protein